jgi:hypothetical protein
MIAPMAGVPFDQLPADIRARLVAQGAAPASRARLSRRTVLAEWTYRCRAAGCTFEVTSKTETKIERHCHEEGHVRYEIVLTSAS